MAHIRPLMSAVSYQDAVFLLTVTLASQTVTNHRDALVQLTLMFTFAFPIRSAKGGAKNGQFQYPRQRLRLASFFWDGKGFARKRRSNDAYRRAYVSYSSKSSALLTFVAPGIRVREGQRETERAIVRSAWAKSGWNVDKQKSIHWHDTTPLVET